MPPADAPVLSDRALNRALLARQGLLERTGATALDMIERLVGLQAQEPEDPYVALWSRLEGFDPQELSGLLSERAAARAQLMRSTIHLVSARDLAAIQPLTAGLLARTFNSPWAAKLGDVPRDEVAAAGAELLAERPRTRAELSSLLGPRWPNSDPPALAHAVTFNLPLVQVPPRGLWGQSGQATWALTTEWLGDHAEAEASADSLVLRYLAAFGPAAVADIRTWSGLTGLREVVNRLRPELRGFRDESGRELLDVHDGLLPDPETPAPPRFLPEYDNVLLSYADRSRVLGGLGPGLPFPRGRAIGTLLYDGFYRANWKIDQDAGVATLTVDRFKRRPGDPGDALAEIEAEARGLLRLVVPEAGEHRVQFVPRP